MSTAVYQEPYRFPAWILALLVHGVFFSLLYFGFSWQTQKVASQAAAMSVELWQSLPEPAPPVVVKIEKVTPPSPPPPPEVVDKPDIVMPENKPKKPVEIKPEVVKPPPKPEAKKPEVKKIEVKNPEVRPEGKVAANGVKGGVVSGAPGGQATADSQAARDKAAQESAAGRVVDEYSGKIKSKIKRNIVMPPGVANDARAEFTVTLLPGGTVLNVHLTRSSGNPTYDSAVERAILKSDPLPLPEDQGMFKRFRELNLSFKPVE